MTHYIWLFLLIGYALSLGAEYKIHASNIRYLIHHGASIRGSRVLSWFYRCQLGLVLAAIFEHVSFNHENRYLSISGLALLGVGFLIRQWGILRQGRLWTRNFVVFNRKLVTKSIAGPGWMQKLDIIGRVMEIVGFCLVLQSFATLTATLIILPIWYLLVLRIESKVSNPSFHDL